MNSNPKQRPKADELSKILIFWYHSINGEMFSYKGSKVEAIFEEDNKELREIPSTYGKNHSNIYISQEFSFSKLPNPSNSSITNSYFEENMNNEGISDKYENCSYCNKSITEELWCNECDPHYMIGGWTSGIPDIDKFIKDTMYNARNYNYCFLEWIVFDRFTGIKQICEDELAKVYTATWIDGKSEFNNESWKKYEFKSMEIILKSLDESQNMSPKCLNELKFYWNLSKKYKVNTTFKFYGITKNPKTKEIMIVIELTNLKSLRNVLTNDFKNILWKDKICLLQNLAFYLKYLHELNYFCKVLHCGDYSWILNFELFEQANEQKLGLLPYIAPEVLNGDPYTFFSDIYSFGIVMTELSSGKPPYYNRSHDSNLATDICIGLRPEFEKGTPEIYKELAYKCMNANSIERPKTDELYQILDFWNDILNGKVLGYIGKEIEVMFENADKEIPNISTLYEKNPDAKYTSQVFTFSNLPKPVNSSIVISYLKGTNNKENNQADNKICSYCHKLFIEKLWCKECDPYCMIEGWTSGNLSIDKFIKGSIYNARQSSNSKFLEWVSFNRFTDIDQIGKGGFAKVYSAIWIDGKSKYEKLNDGSWKKLESKPTKVALKKLNGSQNISSKYLNELEIYWNFYLESFNYLDFYGITRDPTTNEFAMILEFANNGNLRNALSYKFNSILWKDKILLLYDLVVDLSNMHKLGYFHKDLHSGNILLKDRLSYISDFGLSVPANEQKSDNKVYGVLPYIAPEVLNKEPYTSSSDIYSFGIIMIELSFGKPPFYNRKHDLHLALAICDGLRPEFGKGTPEVYKKLAYRCTNANSIKRPTADELFDIMELWHRSIIFGENFSYNGKEIKAILEEADIEIPNISTFYEKDPDAIYPSRELTFNNLSKPINSSIISSYLQEDKINEATYHDSQLADLDFKR
ncbi:Cdc15p [Rhizophagus irregularis DAOM 197198w]|uniref:Cdc15p n=1 Tax=Rhizophagus irregularis (strain DAOM 197198w) TaxID=1432141 RepID=A0A015K8X3_RHIIW|nr:Cdc15p [Rhizophagus irregularis DAOM 197198w]